MKHRIMGKGRWMLWAGVAVLLLAAMGAATLPKAGTAPTKAMLDVGLSATERVPQPTAVTSDAAPEAASPLAQAGGPQAAVESGKPRARVGRLEGQHKKSHLSLPEARRAVKGMDVSSPEAPGNTNRGEPTAAQPVIVALALPQADPGAPAPSSLETAMASARSLFNQAALMGVPYMLSTGEEYARGRRESVVPMLNALKILVDNGAPPEEAQPYLPSAGGFFVVGPHDTPQYAALVKEHEEQWEARRKAEVLLDAWSLRWIVVHNIAGYYMQPPYATDELRQLATDILKDQALVNTLVQKAEANIPSPPPPAPVQQPVPVKQAIRRQN